MSWYDEVRYYSRRGGYDRGLHPGFEPHTAAFAGPGLFSPGLLGGADYVGWRERAAGFAPPERFGRYGYDYGYARRRYGGDFGPGGPRRAAYGHLGRRGAYDRGWRSW